MRIGIVGLRGHVGDCLKGAAQWKDAEIVAVSDVDKDEVASFCKKTGLAQGAEQFTDWKHLVEHAMLDVAIVADENVVRADQLGQRDRLDLGQITRFVVASLLPRVVLPEAEPAGRSNRNQPRQMDRPEPGCKGLGAGHPATLRSRA